jgi:hydroxyacylglutathione hydrolase
VLLGRDDEDALEAAELALAVDVTEIAGYLAGGMTSWREEKRPVDRIERIEIDDLHERWDQVQVLDVREADEYASGHLPGSVNVPYHDVDGLPDVFDPEKPIAVLCASGQRAGVATGLVQAAGARDVIHVTGGGAGTWERRGWPTERDAS